MDSLQIDILDPRVKKILKNLEQLNLISIRKKKSGDFQTLLKDLRKKSDSAPDLEEITREVELVRSERYANKG